jgi:hypothetical protein
MITIYGLDADYIFCDIETIKISKGDIQFDITLSELIDLLDILVSTYHQCSEIRIIQRNYLYKKESDSKKISITYNIDTSKTISLNYENLQNCLSLICELSQLDSIKNKIIDMEITNHSIY